MEISDTPFFKSPAPILPTPPFLWEEKSKLSFFSKISKLSTPFINGWILFKNEFFQKVTIFEKFFHIQSMI